MNTHPAASMYPMMREEAVGSLNAVISCLSKKKKKEEKETVSNTFSKSTNSSTMSRTVTIASVVKMGHLVITSLRRCNNFLDAVMHVQALLTAVVKTRYTWSTYVDFAMGGAQTRALRQLPLNEPGPSSKTSTHLIARLSPASGSFRCSTAECYLWNRRSYSKKYWNQKKERDKISRSAWLELKSHTNNASRCTPTTYPLCLKNQCGRANS